jgi:hypothetical protein
MSPSTIDCPWHIVRADDKKNARLIVSRIVLDTLYGLELKYPETSEKRRRELPDIRNRLFGGTYFQAEPGRLFLPD